MIEPPSSPGEMAHRNTGDGRIGIGEGFGPLWVTATNGE